MTCAHPGRCVRRVWLHVIILLVACAVGESDDVEDGRARLLEKLRDRDYLVRHHGFRPEGAGND